MPIHELVDYFNDRFRQDEIQFLPDEPLRLRGDRVTGWFGGFQIHSGFKPLLASGTRLITSHEACTRSLDVGGRAVTVRELFDAANNSNAVVYLDRLCRLVHMLNYLVHSEKYATLFLCVAPRHILGVPGNHGRYFEEILHRCGLSSAQIAITLDGPINGVTQPQSLIDGLCNYRRNGYRLATRIDRAVLAEDRLDPLLRLAPDFLRLDGTLVRAALASADANRDYQRLVNFFRSSGSSVVQKDVSTAEHAQIATAAGVDLLCGEFVGGENDEISWNQPQDLSRPAIRSRGAVRFSL